MKFKDRLKIMGWLILLKRNKQPFIAILNNAKIFHR